MKNYFFHNCIIALVVLGRVLSLKSTFYVLSGCTRRESGKLSRFRREVEDFDGFDPQSHGVGGFNDIIRRNWEFNDKKWTLSEEFATKHCRIMPLCLADILASPDTILISLTFQKSV
jgi:hypothetical protein